MRYLKNSMLIVASCLLAGCGLFQNGPHANIKLQSANYLNPDINGNPAPVVVTIYELKDSFAFKQATYQALLTNSASAIGNDLIDQQTVEVRPDSSTSVTQMLSPNTQYLGIVAAYRNIDNANWRAVVAVPPNTQSMSIRLSLEAQGLSVKAN